MATATVGSTRLLISSSKRVTLPKGHKLTFGSVTVFLVVRTVIGSTQREIEVQPVLGEIPAGATSLDTSRPVPEEAFIEETIVLSVEESNKLIPLDLPGVDQTAIPLEGRLISPRALTDEMRIQSKLPMVWQRGMNTELRGTFYFLPTISSRLSLESFFGDPIVGFLQGGSA